MATWNMDDWNFVARQVVTDPQGRKWSIGVMDILGQEGDPEMPSHLVEAQHQAGRYFTIIYNATGAVQYERAHQNLEDATAAYDKLLEGVFRGTYDPAQPVFRADLED